MWVPQAEIFPVCRVRIDDAELDDDGYAPEPLKDVAIDGGLIKR